MPPGAVDPRGVMGRVGTSLRVWRNAELSVWVQQRAPPRMRGCEAAMGRDVEIASEFQSPGSWDDCILHHVSSSVPFSEQKAPKNGAQTRKKT
jgi:hypothetical protein